MFDITKLKPAYKNLIGWREHHDTAEIDIDSDLVESESGEFYQDYHPALRLDYISAILPENQNLEEYLLQKTESALAKMFNDFLQSRQTEQFGKTLLEQAQLLNRTAWGADKITNMNRFVGYQIAVMDVSGLEAVINEIGLQLDGADTIRVYLFHSEQEDSLQDWEITTTGRGTTWKVLDEVLAYMVSEERHGGVYVLGYYQNELTAAAINYTNFNWDVGECSGCGTNYYNLWTSIRKHFFVYPIYCPAASLPADEEGNIVKGKMFDLSKAFPANDQSWGINLKFTVRCNFTEFFIQNRWAFKNLLGLRVALSILQDMKFSQEINAIEESLKMMIIRDLEGDKDTKALTLDQQYKNELKAVKFNTEGINSRCLPYQNENIMPTIGAV